MNDAAQNTNESVRSRLKAELSDWDVSNLPAMFGPGRTITISTHEFVVERSTPLFRFFSIMHKIVLVAATMVLILGMLAALLVSIQLMDNLRVVHEMQNQNIPNSSQLYNQN